MTVPEVEELWKPIPGYEGFYEASTHGRIRSVDRIRKFKCRYGYMVNRPYKGRVLVQSFDGKKNYLQINLSKDGKSKMELVHRLIATTFLDNPYNLPEVNHIDENKTNNSVSNLEWCNRIYNSNYGSKKDSTRGSKNPMSKISEQVVLEIKQSYIPNDKEYGITGLARRYNLSQTHVCAIIKGRRWGWLNASNRNKRSA